MEEALQPGLQTFNLMFFRRSHSWWGRGFPAPWGYCVEIAPHGEPWIRSATHGTSHQGSCFPLAEQLSCRNAKLVPVHSVCPGGTDLWSEVSARFCRCCWSKNLFHSAACRRLTGARGQGTAAGSWVIITVLYSPLGLVRHWEEGFCCNCWDFFHNENILVLHWRKCAKEFWA